MIAVALRPERLRPQRLRKMKILGAGTVLSPLTQASQRRSQLILPLLHSMLIHLRPNRRVISLGMICFRMCGNKGLKLQAHPGGLIDVDLDLMVAS